MELSNKLCECGCGRRTKIAKRTWGSVRKGEPLRFVDRHQGVTGGRPRIKKRWEPRGMGFETPCWVWLLATNRQGYGIDFDRRRNRTVHAHVVAWESRNGPVPPGHHLHHRCEVPACCSPDHLMPLDPAEHVRLHQAIVDREEVRNARRSGERRKDTLVRLGISPSTYYRALREDGGAVADDQRRFNGGAT